MCYIRLVVNLNKVSPDKLTKYATQAAVGLSSLLFILKIIAWWTTGSDTLKISCLDSGFDMIISSINLLIVVLIIRKQNTKYVYGYDKIAALAALSQVVLMFSIIIYTLSSTLSFDTPNTNLYSISILILSLVLSYVLIKFQKYVDKRTNSIIVKADMMHYQTDLFINSASILGLMISWVYKIWWIDAFLAIIIGLYLLRNIAHLGFESLSILLDRKQDENAVKQVRKSLYAYDVHNIHITFSGMREIVYLELVCSEDEKLHEIKNKEKEIEHILKQHHIKRIIDIRIKIK